MDLRQDNYPYQKLWESVESAILCGTKNDELEKELAYRNLLRHWELSFDLTPSRDPQGITTWKKSDIISPCPFCKSTDLTVADTGCDFPGQEDYAMQVLCGCGAGGPHGEDKQDAISRWNIMVGG
jgi:Restriction alleviation protein Lar